MASPERHYRNNPDIKTLPIYATINPYLEVSLGYHNLAGVLNAATEQVARRKSRHYGQRNGDFPRDIRVQGTTETIHPPMVGVLVEEVTEPIASQFDYLSTLRGEPIGLWTQADVLAHDNVMVAPYINTPNTEAMITGDLGAEVFGLPSGMVDALKNKKTFREIVTDLDMETLRIPDYRATTIDDIQAAAVDMLDFQETLYTDLDMQAYTRGTVIQSVNSDGGFGSVMIKENKEKTKIQIVQDGKLATVLDGTDRDKWTAAFEQAHTYLSSVIDPGKNDEIIVSRYIEHDDSPGGSVIVIDGELADIGWNGQLINEGSNACVGTGTYTPKTEQARRVKDAYEAQSVDDTKRILQEAADISGVDFATVNGLAGIDFMIPSQREHQLQKRRQQSTKWNGPAPSVYAVECNARGTNWTDAVKLLMYMYNDPQTVGNMRKRIQEGIQTYDAVPLIEDVSGEEVRAELLRQYESYQQTDSGLSIVRMIPPTEEGSRATIGLITHKDVREKRDEVDKIARTIWERKVA